MKTVLITGTSSGIGRATVLEFQRRGWNVIATMRTPEKETELGSLSNVFLTPLDVTNEASIHAAIQAGIARFGSIDVVVNNAGYGLSGVFEGVTAEQIRRQFDTNVFGVMAVTRAILPYFRQRKAGTIVNVSSMGGRITFPLYSVYHSSKWAVEGFTESLQYELEPLGIRLKLVEPGAIQTDFYTRSNDSGSMDNHPNYAPHVAGPIALMNETGANAASPEIVAKTIYKAATSTGSSLRFPVGSDAKALILLRGLIPTDMFRALIRFAVMSRGKNYGR